LGATSKTKVLQNLQYNQQVEAPCCQSSHSDELNQEGVPENNKQRNLSCSQRIVLDTLTAFYYT
jgi:hypothetical protein